MKKKRWVMKRRLGLEFDYRPDDQTIYTCVPWNEGVTAWTPFCFSSRSSRKNAAKWLRKLADRIESHD